MSDSHKGDQLDDSHTKQLRNVLDPKTTLIEDPFDQVDPESLISHIYTLINKVCGELGEDQPLEYRNLVLERLSIILISKSNVLQRQVEEMLIQIPAEDIPSLVKAGLTKGLDGASVLYENFGLKIPFITEYVKRIQEVLFELDAPHITAFWKGLVEGLCPIQGLDIVVDPSVNISGFASMDGQDMSITINTKNANILQILYVILHEVSHIQSFSLMRDKTLYPDKLDLYAIPLPAIFLELFADIIPVMLGLAFYREGESYNTISAVIYNNLPNRIKNLPGIEGLWLCMRPIGGDRNIYPPSSAERKSEYILNLGLIIDKIRVLVAYGYDPIILSFKISEIYLAETSGGNDNYVLDKVVKYVKSEYDKLNLPHDFDITTFNTYMDNYYNLVRAVMELSTLSEMSKNMPKKEA